MKRLLLIAPLVLLILLLNACINISTDTIPAAHWTAMAQTLTAAAWTPVPTGTFNASIPTIVSWLNTDMLITNALGSTIDADYHVNDIKVENIPNSRDLIFRVEVGCSCIHDNCCTPERTFVTIVETMKRFNTSNPPVPTGLTQMVVVCFDQKTKSPIGAISVAWQNVSNYVWGPLDGHQLGVQITRTMAP